MLGSKWHVEALGKCNANGRYFIYRILLAIPYSLEEKLR